MLDEPLEVAVEAVREGGRVLLDLFERSTLSATVKADSSLQTTADLRAEEAIVRVIEGADGSAFIRSEERGETGPKDSADEWIVDPLDGTENFVLGLPYFSSTVTLRRRGEPVAAAVLNPVTSQLYTAMRGQGAWVNDQRLSVSVQGELRRARLFEIPDYTTKRLTETLRLRESLYTRCRRMIDTWAPALDWCLVASGRLDALVVIAATKIEPSGGTLFIEEAGGNITDLRGAPFREAADGRLIASNGTRLHDELLAVAAEALGLAS